MSRLRRMVLCDRFFFITCRVHRLRGNLTAMEFALLADAVNERRRGHGFLVTAWVFLPDHWHAIIFPRNPQTLSGVLESIKVSATRLINRRRGERGGAFSGTVFRPRAAHGEGI